MRKWQGNDYMKFLWAFTIRKPKRRETMRQLECVYTAKRISVLTPNYSDLTENVIVYVANDTQISETRIYRFVEQMEKSLITELSRVSFVNHNQT